MYLKDLKLTKIKESLRHGSTKLKLLTRSSFKKIKMSWMENYTTAIHSLLMLRLSGLPTQLKKLLTKTKIKRLKIKSDSPSLKTTIATRWLTPI